MTAEDIAKNYPDLFKQETWSNMCLYLSRLEMLARRKDQAGPFIDFVLVPVIQEWIRRNGKQAQTYALMGRPFSSADLHYGPPNAEIAAAAVHAGVWTHDASGKPVITPQWAALHGW